MRLKIAFIPDGGPRTGLGHLARCVAIAQSIERVSGERAVFINGDARSRAWVSDRGFHAASSLRGRWDVIVLDSYLRTKREAEKIRKRAEVFAVIDDLGKPPLHADWVINSGIRANCLSYSGANAKGFMLGPRFHPLRAEFWEAKRLPRVSSEVRDVFISLGGASRKELIEEMIVDLKTVLPNGVFHTVLGPYTPGVAVGESGNRFAYHRSPRDMPALLSRMDMAISAGGQTLYELAFMGVPTLAVEIAANQRENIKGFTEAGVVRSLGKFRDRGWKRRLKNSFLQLSATPATRRSLTEAGRGLVDGKGGQRLALVLLG